MDNQYLIIKTLDNAPRILFWKMDVFLVMLFPFLIGLYFGSLALIIFGFIGTFFYAKIQKRFLRGVFKHKLYWALPKKAFVRFGILKNIVPSHLREFIS